METIEGLKKDRNHCGQDTCGYCYCKGIRIDVLKKVLKLIDEWAKWRFISPKDLEELKERIHGVKGSRVPETH